MRLNLSQQHTGRPMSYRFAVMGFLFAVLCMVVVPNAQAITDPSTSAAPHRSTNLQTQTTTTAQTQTGASLSGMVTDQTGAAVRDVEVTLKDIDTGETRTLRTNGGGRYQTYGLSSGHFEIRAAKQGFAAQTRAGIDLAAGQDATVDFT